MQLGTLEFEFAGSFGQSTFAVGEARFLRDDARFAGVEFLLASIESEPFVTRPLVFDVELRFPRVELALAFFELLSGVVEFQLPRTAAGRFEVEGVDLRLLLGDAELQFHLARGDFPLALAELFKPLHQLIGFLELRGRDALTLGKIFVPLFEPIL